MKIRVLLMALVFAVVTLALVPHGTARAREAHVLSYSDELDVTTLNPDLASSGNILDMAGLTMGFLTRTDTHVNPTPELATVVPTQQNGGISRDGKIITWHLRHGVKWSDGQPFDADDVVFSFNAVLNKANNIYSRDGFDYIKRIDEPNKFTVVVHLSQPDAAYFEHEFGSDGNNALLPKHILGSMPNINEAPYNSLPVGVGPFRYVAFNRGQSVEMEANPYYFRGRPKLNRVDYRIITDDNTLLTQLQTGELDLWTHIASTFAPRARTLPNKTTQVVPSKYTSAVYFNVSHPTVSDPAVRRALRYATDRKAIYQKTVTGAGILQESFLPTVVRDYYAVPADPFDIRKANAILDRAGWRRGPDGTRAKAGQILSIDMAIPSGYQPSAVVAELIRTTWAQIGVKLDLHPYATAQFFAPYSVGGIVQTGKFDAALLSQSSDPIADAIDFVGCTHAPPSGSNLMRYCNHAVDADFEKYQSIYDHTEQAKLAKDAQLRVHDDAPMIVMYERAFVFTGDSNIKNFHPKAFGEMDDFMNVDI